MQTKKRFDTLDAWRGICACLIVFHHFNYDIQSHFQHFSFTHNGYIFVDYFFVLSGFVIACSYQDRLINGLPLRDYIFLRLGRIYPLHIFVLTGFVLFELSKFVVDMEVPPFSTDNTSINALIANVFLVHSLGFFDKPSWNAPSWSISVEFYTYILYALSLYVFRKRIFVPASFIVLVTPFIFLSLGKETIDIIDGYSFLRCIYGFSAGVVCFKMYQSISKFNLGNFKFYTLLEIFSLGTVIAFVMYFAETIFSLWAPYIFSFSILVFCLERGLISKILLKKPFLFVGMLSYSIYMVHVFIQLVLCNIIKVFEKIMNIQIFELVTIDDKQKEMLGHNLWQGDLWQLGGFISVLIVSTFTYYFIENTCNRWVRRRIQKKDKINVPEASGAAF